MLKYPPVSQKANVTRQSAAVLRRTAKLVLECRSRGSRLELNYLSILSILSILTNEPSQPSIIENLGAQRRPRTNCPTPNRRAFLVLGTTNWCGANTTYQTKPTKDYVRNYQQKMQNKPNLQNAQMNVNLYNTRVYKNQTAFGRRKNKPNSNPIKPNCLKGKIDAKCVLTKDYRKKDDFAVRKNKPNLVKGIK